MTTEDQTLPAVPWRSEERKLAVPESVGAVAVAARESASIRTAMEAAKMFPREELECYQRIVASCERPSFAEEAQYLFSRGGKDIKGPSVRLAREAARIWGNMRYGLTVVSMTKDTHPTMGQQERAHIKGWAWDVQANSYAEADDSFWMLHQRKDGRGPQAKTIWTKPDERDARELVNRRGAICLRNAILQLIPSDVIDDACARADKTLRASVTGAFKEGREAAVKKLVRTFADVGVNVKMIEARVGHDLDTLTEDEYMDLVTAGQAVRDDPTARASLFDMSLASKPKKKQAAAKSSKPAQGDGEDDDVPFVPPENMDQWLEQQGEKDPG